MRNAATRSASACAPIGIFAQSAWPIPIVQTKVAVSVGNQNTITSPARRSFIVSAVDKGDGLESSSHCGWSRRIAALTVANAVSMRARSARMRVICACPAALLSARALRSAAASVSLWLCRSCARRSCCAKALSPAAMRASSKPSERAIVERSAICAVQYPSSRYSAGVEPDGQIAAWAGAAAHAASINSKTQRIVVPPVVRYSPVVSGTMIAPEAAAAPF